MLALTPGTRLGPYEILDAIGAGGPPSLGRNSYELRRGLAEAKQRNRQW